jgi:hypothetical protein
MIRIAMAQRAGLLGPIRAARDHAAEPEPIPVVETEGGVMTDVVADKSS